VYVPITFVSEGIVLLTINASLDMIPWATALVSLIATNDIPPDVDITLCLIEAEFAGKSEFGLVIPITEILHCVFDNKAAVKI
jgi:hypothetical protein